LKCEEIMISDPSWCVPTDPVTAIAEVMNSEEIDTMPVCENRRSKHLVAVVTDLICHSLVNEPSANETTIQAVMTREPITCHRDDDLHVALNTLERNQVRRIPVVDEGGQLLGIITLEDVILWTGTPERITEMIRTVALRRHARKSPPWRSCRQAPAGSP
jgi:CBS domain-containing protein